MARLTTATPRGALKLLAAALRDGDAERIRQVMYAANPTETKMVAAMADMARSMAALQKSAIKAFGREGVLDMVHLVGMYLATSALLNAFEVPAPPIPES